MDWQELGMTAAARTLLVYAAMLVVIRLLGKRTVGAQGRDAPRVLEKMS